MFIQNNHISCGHKWWWYYTSYYYEIEWEKSQDDLSLLIFTHMFDCHTSLVSAFLWIQQRLGMYSTTTTSSATDKPSCWALQTVYDLRFDSCSRFSSHSMARNFSSDVLKQIDFSAALKFSGRTWARYHIGLHSSSQDPHKALSASLIEGLVCDSYTRSIRFVDAVSLVRNNLAISSNVAGTFTRVWIKTWHDWHIWCIYFFRRTTLHPLFQLVHQLCFVCFIYEPINKLAQVCRYRREGISSSTTSYLTHEHAVRYLALSSMASNYFKCRDTLNVTRPKTG